MKSKISEQEFVQAMTTAGLDRPRGKNVHLNLKVVFGDKGNWAEWDCPVCQTHNRQRWFGRAYHICSKCEQPTELKG